MQAFLTVLKAIVLWPFKVLRSFWLAVCRLLRSPLAWVMFVLSIIAALVVYYVSSDLYTPLTTDAYVQAYVVQVAPRVEGEVVRVCVKENQSVSKGDLLFEIDPRPYEHRVEMLTAQRVEAVQEVAQMESELAAAKADDARLAAEEAYAKLVHEQEKKIYEKDATTDRSYVSAMQNYKAAQAARRRSEAQMRKLEQALAARIGNEHALIAKVEAQLAQARLNLEWTRLRTPCDGLITDLQLREGAYAHVGQPVMTLIDTSSWLVVANYRENALAQLRVGQPARVAFRSLPARLFDARVVSVGWGVSQGQGIPSGQLPDVAVPKTWVPPAQRFQVRVKLDDPQSVPMRVGMTGSVAVYTRSEHILNDVTNYWHQVIAWFYHL